MNRAAVLPAVPGATAERAGGIVLALLLWGIFLIKFPALIGAALLAGIVLVVHYVVTVGSMDRINLLILLNMSYWIYSGMLSGALTLATLLTPAYYSNEGRIFVTYLAFVILSSCVVGVATLRLALRLVALMAVAGILLYLAWVVAKPALLSVGRAHNFSGFITSHTGTGTFYSCLSIFLTIYGARLRSRVHVLLGLTCLLPVLGSASREALAALAVVLAWFLLRTLSLKSVLIAALLITGLAGAMPRIAPHTFQRTAEVFDADTVDNIRAQVANIATTQWEPGQDKELAGENFNILSRVLYWSYAVQLFRDSPILGAGFGRFNDYYVRFAGEPGFFYFAVSGQSNPATLHAHNSYLQLLAETGLVGLLLLLAIWYGLWRRMAQARREFAQVPEIDGFYQALQGLIVFLLVAALFGHALGAPVDAIPTLALLGLGAGFFRTHRVSGRVPQGSGPAHHESAAGQVPGESREQPHALPSH